MNPFVRKILVACMLIGFYLFIGTVFFHVAEGWKLVDSFYFSGTTLTTVGYGDLHPTHDLTKIVTVFFAFSGIGIVFYSVGVIGQHYFEREEERMQKMWEAAQQRRQEFGSNQTLRDARERFQHAKRTILRTK
jgi:hypothetical protein